MIYAYTDGKKCRPRPRLTAECPGCRSPVLAKCGKIRSWHWAHKAGEDCDRWAEPIGPWHLGWQDLVRPEFVEVTMEPHRADIVGNGGIVVELQHSAIDPRQITEREKFYGLMVWLFDAANRIRAIRSGDRVFFWLAKWKPIGFCKKPVFLDFGHSIVEVEAFTDLLWNCSGFGWIRDRRWFAMRFLSENLASAIDQVGVEHRKQPLANRDFDSGHSLKQATRWFDPLFGTEYIMPVGTPIVPMNFPLELSDPKREPVWSRLIGRHPTLANGWTKTSLLEMSNFLEGKAVILNGLLRLLPSPAAAIRVTANRDRVEYLLECAEGHARAGRIPVLGPDWKATLRKKSGSPS